MARDMFVIQCKWMLVAFCELKDYLEISWHDIMCLWLSESEHANRLEEMARCLRESRLIGTWIIINHDEHLWIRFDFYSNLHDYMNKWCN